MAPLNCFKQPVEFIKNLGFKKVAPNTGNRAQRRAAQKKGHSGSKKNKDKVNKQRQKQNKAAKQQRKNTKNDKSKNWNSKSNTKSKSSGSKKTQTPPLASVSHAKKHMVSAQAQKGGKLVTTKSGVSGGHNQDEFYKALKQSGYYPNHVKIVKTPVPGQKGVYDIRYNLQKQKSGGGFVNEYTEPFKKTVYDPKYWSDNKIFDLGQKAMKQGKIQPNGKVQGTASNGMKFIGYIKDGKITNFHPIDKFK